MVAGTVPQGVAQVAVLVFLEWHKQPTKVLADWSRGSGTLHQGGKRAEDLAIVSLRRGGLA